MHDDGFLDALRAGDEMAWAVFVSTYRNVVYSVLSKTTVPTSDRDDLVQEVFLACYRSVRNGTIDSLHRIHGWLAQRAVYVYLDWLRGKRGRSGKRPQELTGIEADSSDLEENPVESAQSKEHIALVRQAVESLSEDDRNIADLHFFKQMTVPQISERLGRTVFAIKHAIKRIKMRLRQHLARHFGED